MRRRNTIENTVPSAMTDYEREKLKIEAKKNLYDFIVKLTRNIGPVAILIIIVCAKVDFTNAVLPALWQTINGVSNLWPGKPPD